MERLQHDFDLFGLPVSQLARVYWPAGQDPHSLEQAQAHDMNHIPPQSPFC